MIDFEHSVMNAFQNHFPKITIRTCMFHLAQSFNRKLVECGFKTQYDENKHLNIWFKKVIVLSFISPSKVTDVFVELLEDMHNTCDLQGEFKNLENFVDYMYYYIILAMMEHLHFPLNFGTISMLTNEQIMMWKRTITV